MGMMTYRRVDWHSSGTASTLDLLQTLFQTLQLHQQVALPTSNPHKPVEMPGCESTHMMNQGGEERGPPFVVAAR